MSTVEKATGTRTQRREALKEAIRAAARTQFIDHGFEKTGIREISAIAGVNPAIVIRHFGSKEALFLEAMATGSFSVAALEGPIEQVGRALVAATLDAGQAAWRNYAVLLGASGRPEVNALLRRSFDENIASRLLPKLSGEDAAMRVHLFTAQFAGLLTAFSLYEQADFSGVTKDEIIAVYGDAMQSVLVP